MIRASLKVGLGVRPIRAPILRIIASNPQASLQQPKRHMSSKASGPTPGAQGPGSGPSPIKIDKPTYQLTFTCKKCEDRSSHLVSKQAYHNGTVLIQCPSCKNRHLIADHLKVFGQGAQSLEDILASRGEKITKASLDGDLQWEPEAEGVPQEPKELGSK